MSHVLLSPGEDECVANGSEGDVHSDVVAERVGVVLTLRLPKVFRFAVLADKPVNQVSHAMKIL